MKKKYILGIDNKEQSIWLRLRPCHKVFQVLSYLHFDECEEYDDVANSYDAYDAYQKILKMYAFHDFDSIKIIHTQKYIHYIIQKDKKGKYKYFIDYINKELDFAQ